MGKRFSFYCHCCGDCCANNTFTNVSLTIDEIYKFRDLFPIILSCHFEKIDIDLFNFFKSHKDGISDDGVYYTDKNNKSIYFDCLPDFYADYGDFGVMASLAFHGVTFNNKGKGCHFLDSDHLCKLFKSNNAPSVCYSVPLDPNALRNLDNVESFLLENMKFFIKHKCVRIDDSFEPLPSNFIPFFQDGKFLSNSPIVIAAREERKKQLIMSNDSHLLCNLIYYNQIYNCCNDILPNNEAFIHSNVKLQFTLPISFIFTLIFGYNSPKTNDYFYSSIKKFSVPLFQGDKNLIYNYVLSQEKQFTNLLQRNIPKDRFKEVALERDAYRMILRDYF